MIYPLAFGFANFECTKSWTWFLTQLREVILHPKLVMIVSDWYTCISNGMKAIFLDAAHGVCAYHSANLYYRATYVYRVEEFDHFMVELKAIHLKVPIPKMVTKASHGGNCQADPTSSVGGHGTSFVIDS
ncbi:hypothetical protein LWI29_035608 [Acer saccharum]|uniref:MULE transposase domain-containing protein n=1 Tax=Acer saccharum TaxID=4024 RepID=A0AA39W152_ACESA|nr:hypothetical protein LWI29_035608 [Acer saccharum]